MKTALAALTALLVAAPAFAAEPPMPRMFRGVSMDKGQWRMEILGGEHGGRTLPGGMPAMTMCTDNVLKEEGRRGGAPRAREGCTYRMLKDTADEAVMETACPDGSSRVTLRREGDKRFLMQAETKGRDGPSSMRMRYTYEGACAQGPGRGPGAMSFDKDSEPCRQMKAQAAAMDPATACANAGAQRAACEARMRAATEQMQAMCR
jgi:hypothetical protein